MQRWEEVNVEWILEWESLLASHWGAEYHVGAVTLLARCHHRRGHTGLPELFDCILLKGGHHPPRCTEEIFCTPIHSTIQFSMMHPSGIFRAKDQMMPLTYLIHSRVSCHTSDKFLTPDQGPGRPYIIHSQCYSDCLTYSLSLSHNTPSIWAFAHLLWTHRACFCLRTFALAVPSFQCFASTSSCGCLLLVQISA